MHKRIYSHVKKYISDHQHGFCEGRSTTTNLLTFWNYVSRLYWGRRTVDTIYTDFSKAFDSVSHTYLIQKLKSLGIHGTLLNWCKSYLSGRTFKVVFNGYMSDSFEIHSGVPQGSALGPLFFVIFINDLSQILTDLRVPQSHVFYADDLKIYLKIIDSNDSERLQTALNSVWDWCNRWNLKLNLKKCQTITFHSYRNLNIHETAYHLNNYPLQRVNQINDLESHYSQIVYLTCIFWN